VTLPEFQAHQAIFEGRIPFLYLDAKGNVTCGIGHLVSSLAACHALSWQNSDGTVAAQNSITRDWLSVLAMPKGLLASHYEPATTVRLCDAAITSLFAADTQTVDSQLTHVFSEFTGYPPTAQYALRDMAFNLGTNGLIMKFPHLRAAVLAHDWNTAAQQCRRADISEARNSWTRSLFAQAAGAGL
jgi:GH24 family phage-related lysozyme (muramidase)